MGKIAVIGGGPAGMMAAFQLARAHQVVLYESQRTLGRKFLVAGEGGLNITNSEDGEEMIARYTPSAFMRPFIGGFGSADLRGLLASIGVETYIGSSGRVFPVKGLKPAFVLKRMRQAMEERGVEIRTGHSFTAFTEDARPIISVGQERQVVHADKYLFALGGASWPRTGSTGEWVTAFKSLGVQVVPFRASNCGVECPWPTGVRVHAGRPLKNIGITCGDLSIRGEATITDHGLEGNAVYPLIGRVRDLLHSNPTAVLRLDLKPDVDRDRLIGRLKDADEKQRTGAARLDRVSVALLKAFTPRGTFASPESMASSIKDLHVPVMALRPIQEAISTVGGIALTELAADLSLRSFPHLVCMGEMLDLDAPTGGYLLQSAFSMGYCAAAHLL